MGRVTVKVKISNYIDHVAMSNGQMRPEDVRQVEVEGMIDTGATLCVLPESIVRQLGLPIDRTAPVVYADGRVGDVEVAGGAYLEIKGRYAEVECLVEKDTDQVLIGQVPLEVMDWHVDLKERTLKPRPGWPDAPLLEVL